MVNGKSVARIGSLAAILACASSDYYFSSQKTDYSSWNSQPIRVRFEIQPVTLGGNPLDVYSKKLVEVYYAEMKRREKAAKVNEKYDSLSSLAKMAWGAAAMALLCSYIPNSRRLADRWKKMAKRESHNSRMQEFRTSSWDRLDTPSRLREETTAPIRLGLY
ncbi:hypothetical protein HYV80_04280 [Candidatus Woesearchaeota archaeon]|nr:hypothetical protein [Candidatus Woesearchaeota archaeon]